MARHLRARRVAAGLGLSAFALLAASDRAVAAPQASAPAVPPVLPLPVQVPQLPVNLPELPPLLDAAPGEPAGQTTATTTRPRSTPRPRTSPAVPPPPSAGTAAAAPPVAARPEPRPSLHARGPEQEPVAKVISQAGRSARQFSLPLGMAGVITAFLGVQACLDRRDPKLAKAPLTDEVLGFS